MCAAKTYSTGSFSPRIDHDAASCQSQLYGQQLVRLIADQGLALISQVALTRRQPQGRLKRSLAGDASGRLMAGTGNPAEFAMNSTDSD